MIQKVDDHIVNEAIKGKLKPVTTRSQIANFRSMVEFKQLLPDRKLDDIYIKEENLGAKDKKPITKKLVRVTDDKEPGPPRQEFSINDFGTVVDNCCGNIKIKPK